MFVCSTAIEISEEKNEKYSFECEQRQLKGRKIGGEEHLEQRFPSSDFRGARLLLGFENMFFAFLL